MNLASWDIIKCESCCGYLATREREKNVRTKNWFWSRELEKPMAIREATYTQTHTHTGFTGHTIISVSNWCVRFTWCACLGQPSRNPMEERWTTTASEIA